MMQPTNLIVANPFLTGMPTVQAAPVEFCDVCGGLFLKPGGMFFGMPHSH